jgi:hypothetical protein
MVHQAKRIAAFVEDAAFEMWPSIDATTNEPTLEAFLTPMSVEIINRIRVAEAWIKLAQQFPNHSDLIFLHQIPQRHIDRYATRLDQCDRLGAVIAPMQHTFDVGGW